MRLTPNFQYTFFNLPFKKILTLPLTFIDTQRITEVLTKVLTKKVPTNRFLLCTPNNDIDVVGKYNYMQ